jgi:hypothetical protein
MKKKKLINLEEENGFQNGKLIKVVWKEELELILDFLKMAMLN